MKDREQATDRLLDALNDPGRFVAAHVLLSQIYGQHFDDNRDHYWNGLYRKIGLDDVEYHQEDGRVLSQKWTEFFQTTR